MPLAAGASHLTGVSCGTPASLAGNSYRTIRRWAVLAATGLGLDEVSPRLRSLAYGFPYEMRLARTRKTYCMLASQLDWPEADASTTRHHVVLALHRL